MVVKKGKKASKGKQKSQQIGRRKETTPRTKKSKSEGQLVTQPKQKVRLAKKKLEKSRKASARTSAQKRAAVPKSGAAAKSEVKTTPKSNKKANPKQVTNGRLQTVKPRSMITKSLSRVQKPKNVKKVLPRTLVENSADLGAAIKKLEVSLRNEFKEKMHVEIEMAFQTCLAAMEQAANLMESRLTTVLGEMRNLVAGAKPEFKNGKLRSVVSEDGKERTDYTYGNDEKIISRTYREGRLKFEIVHTRFGNPISGRMFGSSGEVVREFSYGPDGQVK